MTKIKSLTVPTTIWDDDDVPGPPLWPSRATSPTAHVADEDIEIPGVVSSSDESSSFPRGLIRPSVSSINEERKLVQLRDRHHFDESSAVPLPQDIRESDRGYTPIKMFLNFLGIIMLAILVTNLFYSLVPLRPYVCEIPISKYCVDTWAYIFVSLPIYVLIANGGLLYLLYLANGKVYRPSKLAIFVMGAIIYGTSVIWEALLNPVFLCYLRTSTLVMFLARVTIPMFTIVFVSWYLFYRYSPRRYFVIMKITLVGFAFYSYAIGFAKVFRDTNSEIIHSTLLVLFSVSLVGIKEFLRFLIPSDFPVSLRVAYPNSINLIGELYIALVFPNIHSVGVFVFVFTLQFSTNIFRTLMMRRWVWKIKCRIKNYLGIKEQYLNQIYDDYILRASEDYIFILLSQLFSRILFLGIFLPMCYAYNKQYLKNIEQGALELVILFTSAQIVGIFLQTLIARVFIIRIYGHDPFRLWYHLITNERTLFVFLIVGAATVSGTVLLDSTTSRGLQH